MAEIKFEEALKKLEKIVSDMESGDLSLDDALARYEEGIKLSKLCAKKLEAAKKKGGVAYGDQGRSRQTDSQQERQEQDGAEAPITRGRRRVAGCHGRREPPEPARRSS